MRYTLRQLEYFVAAGEAGSIRHASEKLSISQPSISTAIAHLEIELGVQLFVRHHAQGLSLTGVGQILLVEAKKVLSMAESLHAIAAEATGQVRGQLQVGAMVTLAPMIMPELAYNFRQTFPAAEISQRAANHEWLGEKLSKAELDLAITYDLALPPGIAFEPLASLPPHALVAQSHPLAERGEVTLEELAAEPLILLDLPLSRHYFNELFEREGLRPTVYARAAEQEIVRTMVANGYGYTLANVRPRSDRALDGKRLVRLRLKGAHRPMVIGMAMRQGERQSRLLEHFIVHCRASISDQTIPGMCPLDEG
ncbi:LysR family transcriptional regulator [Asaia sp. W19]|uniref:LysR family transcriptional regulator n=1 Tax=unclassified Asaia TaxID=2685023 RepID=UPI000F8F205A|nr:LysR family transcriptional regulator [Asaia sp. W19]RUT26406.1 LysR family transcriptional regulator [Asaia sp. W19]